MRPAQVFRLPQLMLDAPEMARVLAKARAKLLDLYGDLEKVSTSILFLFPWGKGATNDAQIEPTTAPLLRAAWTVGRLRVVTT